MTTFISGNSTSAVLAIVFATSAVFGVARGQESESLDLDAPTEVGLAPSTLDVPSAAASDVASSHAPPRRETVDRETVDRETVDRATILRDYDYPSLDDEPAKLKKLDKNSPIWVSVDRSRVLIGGDVCLREGELEFFACKRHSKEHESIVALDVPPHLIHAALLAIGARQGAPAKFDPKFVPPSGDEIEIEVRWRDPQTNATIKVRAQDMIRENDSRRTMRSRWVFTGGLFGVDPDGKKYYLANVTGEVFGVSNFPGAVLDVPFESTNDSSNLFYSANTDIIPEIDTPVALVLTRKQTRQD